MARISDMTLNNNTTTTFYQFGHTLDPTFTILVSILFIIISVGGVFLNLLLILVIVCTKSLHSTTNILIINLAMGDFITALFTVPIDVDFLLRGYFPYGTTVCGIKETAFMLSLPSSGVNLSLLTFERHLSVTYPFKRIRCFTKWKAVVLISLSWTYSILVATFPVLYDTNSVVVEYGSCYLLIPMSYQMYQVFVNFLGPLLFILILNGLLFKLANRHAIEIRRQSFVNTPQRSRTKSRLSMVSDSLRANVKAAKTVLMLVGVFTFSWIIFIALALWNILCNICHPREVTWSANAVNYSNIVINPLLYGLLNKELRKAMLAKTRTFFGLKKMGLSRNYSGKSEGTVLNGYCDDLSKNAFEHNEGMYEEYELLQKE